MKIATAHGRGETRVGVGEAHAALVEALGGPPDWMVIHSSVHHRAGELRAVLAELGAAQIHGCSSCAGVMSGEGFDPEAIGLFALRDPEGDFGVGSALLGDDPARAAGAALQQAIEAAGRSGELPGLVWVSAAPGHEEACIAGIEALIGTGVPIVGGSAADDAVAGDWYVFDGGFDGSEAIVVSALYPSTALHTVFHSGYVPTETRGRVSAATGRTVHGIDGQPAAQVYDRWTGGAVSEVLGAGGGSVLASTTLHPLGRRVGAAGGLDYYRLAHPESIDGDGGLRLFADVAVDDELILMAGSAEALRSRAGRVAADALAQSGGGAGQVAGALVIFCAGCMLTIRDDIDDVVASLREVLGEVPFLGGFTFGEQGCFVGGENCHGNLMISVTLFMRNRSE